MNDRNFTTLPRPLAQTVVALAGCLTLIALISPMSAYPDCIVAAFKAFRGLDKIVHFTVFCLGYLLLGTCTRLPSWTVTGGLLLFAAGTEIAQGLTGLRTAGWDDFFSNAAGVSAGAALTYYWSKKNAGHV